MKKITAFFSQYKVMIIGLLLSLFGPVNDLLTTGETSTKVLIVAGIGGLITWIARNMRGQWQTLGGIAQLVFGTYLSISSQGPITKAQIAQIIVQALIAYLAASTGPMKSRGYEHAHAIVSAKQEGENLSPTIAPPPTASNKF